MTDFVYSYMFRLGWIIFRLWFGTICVHKVFTRILGSQKRLTHLFQKVYL